MNTPNQDKEGTVDNMNFILSADKSSPPIKSVEVVVSFEVAFIDNMVV